ncbi:hypothetical protein [Krasilnikovia cinnamomea]|uniref:hypothetical protein n=1 Tax=Krasilnikovia cinnamomea TaxID=349313 RepID=UPI00102C32F9|nr:hypothetical protein [Krasilnikovia cinnamomea]
MTEQIRRRAAIRGPEPHRRAKAAERGPSTMAELLSGPAPKGTTRASERATTRAWEGAAEAVDRIREFAAAERLDRTHEAALRLRDRLAEARAEARDRPPRAARLVRTLTAARELARELDIAESVGVLPPRRRDQMGQELGHLAGCLGTDLERVAAPTREPKWLDVASPAHGQVNVAGARTLFRPGHVAASDASAVVVANDCELEAVDHYHLRRVSLDCGSLYRDNAAVESFAAMLAEPSEQSIQAFREQLRRIVSPVPEPGRQVYRERVAARVNTHLDHPDVAVLGDESHVRSTTAYHVRETVVPLADLLYEREDLIQALAEGQGDVSLEKPIQDALGEIEDVALLRYAMNPDGGRTNVRRSLDTRRVHLAAAMMVGAGNTLTHSSEVEAGRARLGNLARFDRRVRQRREKAHGMAERPAAKGLWL